MRVHYIYKITRKEDGAFYIGRHSTTSLVNNYWGSGTYIRASINKHGKDSHVKDILHVVELGR